MMNSLFDRGCLKTVWSQAALEPSFESIAVNALSNPYRKDDPLSRALSYLIAKKLGRTAPPLICQVRVLPVYELCQLVILWAEAGFEEAATDLSRSIPIDFPWLWCKENEYFEEESKSFIEELRTKTKNLKTDSPSLCIEWSFFDAGKIQCALTFSGSRTSQGAIISETVQIRAFGPQKYPLSDPKGFGIRSIDNHGQRWVSPAAAPNIWYETKVNLEPNAIILDLNFFGLTLSEPIVFSFYVKSETAQVGSEQLKPQTLQRYQGAAKPILFGGGLCIESRMPGKLELIPLAGGDGFWGCEYLAAFEVLPLNSKMSFLILFE